MLNVIFYRHVSAVMCFVSVRLRVSIAGSYFWLDYLVILWLSYLPTTDAPIKESANVEQTGFF